MTDFHWLASDLYRRIAVLASRVYVHCIQASQRHEVEAMLCESKRVKP